MDTGGPFVGPPAVLVRHRLTTVDEGGGCYLTSKVVQGWEKEAKAIAGVMEACVATEWCQSVKRNGFEYSNIKPWYNPRWMFGAKGVDRVLVGINPGGNPDKPGPANGQPCDDDKCDNDRLSYYDDDPCCEPYNDWVDAKCWQGRGRLHQERVKCVFASIYDVDVDDVEPTMRATPSFNVCPLRTNGTDGIPDCVWHQSKRWFKRVIKGLQPRKIICNGNGIGANSRSPWRVMIPKLDRWKKIDLEGTQNLKLGIIANEGRKPVRVIGLPPLYRYSGSELYSELSNLREHWSDLSQGA